VITPWLAIPHFTSDFTAVWLLRLTAFSTEPLVACRSASLDSGGGATSLNLNHIVLCWASSAGSVEDRHPLTGSLFRNHTSYAYKHTRQDGVQLTGAVAPHHPPDPSGFGRSMVRSSCHLPGGPQEPPGAWLEAVPILESRHSARVAATESVVSAWPEARDLGLALARAGDRVGLCDPAFETALLLPFSSRGGPAGVSVPASFRRGCPIARTLRCSGVFPPYRDRCLGQTSPLRALRAAPGAGFGDVRCPVDPVRPASGSRRLGFGDWVSGSRHGRAGFPCVAGVEVPTIRSGVGARPAQVARRATGQRRRTRETAVLAGPSRVPSLRLGRCRSPAG